MRHELKVQQPFFDAIWRRDKTFEVLKDDRGFQRGDRLHLHEHEQDVGRQFLATGRQLDVEVTYVFSGGQSECLRPGWVVLGIKLMFSKYSEGSEWVEADK